MSSPSAPQFLRFDGEVAVVTGGGRGIGRAIALALAARGATVVVNDIGLSLDAARYPAEPDPHAVADDVVNEIRGEGGTALSDGGDISVPADAKRLVNATLDAFGRVDIVVNNVGIIIDGTMAELELADLTAVFAVHVGGAFNMCKLVWPGFEAQRQGRILNVGSISGVAFGLPGHLAYDAAKGGLWGLTHSLAANAPTGVRVNLLLPSASSRSAASVARPYERTIPLGPELVAPTALWLVHRECHESGRAFTAGGARTGAVATAVGHGYQHPRPAELDVETVRDNWDIACRVEPFSMPASPVEWNQMRTELFHRAQPDQHESQRSGNIAIRS